MFYYSLKTQIQRIFTLSPALLLGTSATILFSSTANAIDIIDLKYKGTEVSIKTKELSRFADTGEIPPKLQKFFDETEQVPEFLSGLLKQEIYISRSFVKDILDSSTGEFFLLKLNQTINSSSSTEDLEAIKRTIIKAYNDDQELSVLELLKDYPESRLKVDLTYLESAYNDANSFVDKILPAWEVAKSFLEDVVCDCEK